MVYMAPSARSLLWGGRGLSLRFSDTWEWDGEGWVQVADTGPAPRAYAGLAFDSRRNVAVLFTHWPPQTIRETWEWDGAGWTQVDDMGPRAQNILFAMVYDSARQVTLLEGGSLRSGVPLSTTPPVGTWAWDGTAWTQLDDLGPPQRASSALAYDASRQRVVRFGGLNVTGSAYGRDTWEWDGNRWEEVQNIGPVSRFGHAMTGTAGATLLFGGVEVETPPLDSLGDTWTWDGDHWRQRQDIGPSRRWFSAMSWDSARARGVLFGGAAMPPNVGPYLGDTWEAFEGV
jgi:hypothetical protein